jgi:hypothetical protein
VEEFDMILVVKTDNGIALRDEVDVHNSGQSIADMELAD